MNNTVTLIGLVSISVFGFVDPSPSANIPQTGIQEILIEGEFNTINQQLTQRLNLNFISFPSLEESVIPVANIRGLFLDNPNNNVTQTINQDVLGFSLVETNLGNFDIDRFTNYDNVVNGLQFITQEAIIGVDFEGNIIESHRNSITQRSSQTLTDFFWLDQPSSLTSDINFGQFLTDFLQDQTLDSLQFGLQDVFVFGNENIVSQTIDQTLNAFIFTDNDFDAFGDDTNIIDIENPIQFTIQETFIFNEETGINVSENNLVSQSLTQAISNISFFDIGNFFPTQNFNSTSDVLEFDIDAFIEAILILSRNEDNNCGGEASGIEVTQFNCQQARQIGDENTITQNNVQELVVGVSEPSPGKMLGVLLVIVGIRTVYKKTVGLLLIMQHHG